VSRTVTISRATTVEPAAPARRDAPPPEPVHVPPRRVRGEPVGPLQALLRHPFVALVVVLACTGAGVASGLQRTASYASHARLNVGGIDVQSQALPGYVSAVQSLAASYSRAIDSNVVVGRVADRLRLPPAVVEARLAASPVPGSSVIQVDAKGPSEADARRLADAASSALIGYVRGLSGGASSGRGLLRAYRDAELRVSEARRTRQRLSEPGAGSSPRRRAADADYSAAQLEARTLATQYQSSLENQPSRNFISVLTDAGTATSDRASQLKLRAFTGLLAGLILAAGLTTILANRRRLLSGG
jgi:uncharacterized protein involved in exopolysaccharide biosynthesis